MPRQPRFYVPGVPLHVVQRGNNRSAIYADDDDRQFWHGYLQYASRMHGVAIHAYVLMSNHFHLVLTPDSAKSVPGVMQAVGRTYVRYFNEKCARTGTLWEGRYKAAIVDDEHYLLTCMRYVELNPVRAGMVRAPADYRWSSYAANAGGAHDALLTPHPLYLALGNTTRARRAVYRSLFPASPTDSDLVCIRDATQNGWALGDQAFRLRVASFGRRAERLRRGRPPRLQSNNGKSDSDPI